MSHEDRPKGQRKLVTDRRVALYRDEEGRLYAVGRISTHLGRLGHQSATRALLTFLTLGSAIPMGILGLQDPRMGKLLGVRPEARHTFPAHAEAFRPGGTDGRVCPYAATPDRSLSEKASDFSLHSCSGAEWALYSWDSLGFTSDPRLWKRVQPG